MHENFYYSLLIIILHLLSSIVVFAPYSYVTASKGILLSLSLQKDMATRFHKVEFHHLLSEASALDPRFKKRAFSDDHAAKEAFQRLKNAAGRVRLSSSAHQTEQQQAAEPQETQESLVWGDFDEQVAGQLIFLNANLK